MVEPLMPPLESGEALVAEGKPSWRSWIKEHLLLAAGLTFGLVILNALRDGDFSRVVGIAFGLVVFFVIFAFIAPCRFPRMEWRITNRRVLKSDGTVVQLGDILRVARMNTCLYLRIGQFKQVKLEYLPDARATQALIEKLRK